MKSYHIFDALLTYFRHCHRNSSSEEVSKLGKLNRNTFRQAKKCLGISLQPLKEVIQSQSQTYGLILDYVMLSRPMEIVDRPHNLIFNHNERRYVPTLVVLVGCIQTDRTLYPVKLVWWVQEALLEEGEAYLSKTQLVAQMCQELSEEGLKPEWVLFDAALCQSDVLQTLEKQKWRFACRFTKSRKVKYQEQKVSPAEIWKKSYNGVFYFDRSWGYLQSSEVEYVGIQGQLVVVADSREKMLERDFYCIFSNDLETRYTQLMRKYLQRSLIESVFRRLKSYLGLSGYFRHHEEYLHDHFEFCFAALVMIQEIAKEMKKSVCQVLRELRLMSWDEAKVVVNSVWERWAKVLVKSTLAETVCQDIL